MDTVGPAILSFIERLFSLWRLKKRMDTLESAILSFIEMLFSLWRLKDLEVREDFPLFEVPIIEFRAIPYTVEPPIKHFGTMNINYCG